MSRQSPEPAGITHTWCLTNSSLLAFANRGPRSTIDG